MKNKTKSKVIRWSSTGLCVAAPFAATLYQFPVWIEQSSEATVSGLFLLFAFFSCVPFIRQIKEYMKSPSSWVLWTIVLISAVALRNIIDQMVIVAAVGLTANIIGLGLYRVADYVGEKPDATVEGETQNNG
jgi:FtsH-binding integral membrane protein